MAAVDGHTAVVFVRHVDAGPQIPLTQSCEVEQYPPGMLRREELLLSVNTAMPMATSSLEAVRFFNVVTETAGLGRTLVSCFEIVEAPKESETYARMAIV